MSIPEIAPGDAARDGEGSRNPGGRHVANPDQSPSAFDATVRLIDGFCVCNPESKLGAAAWALVPFFGEFFRGPVAQLDERRFSSSEDAGSSPVRFASPCCALIAGGGGVGFQP